MSECYLFTKKQFLEQMEKAITDDEVILFSTIKQGSMRGSSKHKLKGFEVGFTNDCFVNPDSISDILQCMTAGVVFLKKEFWNEETKKFVQKEKEK